MRVSMCLLIASGCLAMRLNPVGWSAQNHARLQALLDQPVSTAHGRAPVAAFDADGTLWSGDAYGAFSSVLVSKGLIDGDASAAVEREYGRSEEQERERAAKEKAEEKFKTILQAYQALTGAGRAQQQQQQYYSNPRTQRGRQARGGHNWGSAEDFGPAGQPGYNPHENYMGFGPGRKGHWCVLSTALHCAVVVL